MNFYQRIGFYLTATSALLLAHPAWAAETNESAAWDHFAKGHSKIENNCGDCMGSSRKGLEEGIAEIEEAIKFGFPNKIQALQELARAYSTLAFVYATSKAEQPAILRKKLLLYEELVKLDSTNHDIWVGYGGALFETKASQEQILKAWKKALALDPNDVLTRFAIAEELIKGKRYADGMKEARTGFKIAAPEEANRAGQRLISFLEVDSRPEEAKEIRRLMAANSKS